MHLSPGRNEGLGGRMAARRQSGWACRAKLVVLWAGCTAIAVAILGSLAVAQGVPRQKRILLMYGDGRVELYPPSNYPPPVYPPPDYPAPDYPAPDYPAPDYPAPDYPPPDYPAPDYSQRQMGTRRAQPAEGFHYFDKPTSTDTSARGQWNEDLRGDTAAEYPQTVDAGPSPHNTLREPLPAPEPADGPWGGGHPLRSAAVQPEPLPGGSSQQTGGSDQSSSSITIQTADEPSPGVVASGQGPGVSSASGKRPGPQTRLPQSLPPGGPAAGADRVLDSGNAARNSPGRDPSADWLATGIVQVMGTLVGLFIGLLVCLLALPFFFRRLAGGKLGPIIRVEIANPPLWGDSAGRLGGGGEVRENRAGPAEAPVPVADFGEQSVELCPPGETYDQQQQAKAEQRKRQEKEIMKQILDKNVALRQELSGLLPAA